MARIVLEVPLEKQRARCTFAALAMGHALLVLPQSIDFPVPRRKLARICERLTRWHGQACEEVGAKRLPPHNGRAVAKLVRRFVALAFPAGFEQRRLFHGAAGFWASVVFLWDARTSCPDYAKTPTWRYLDRASDEFGRLLLSVCDGADLAADRIYEELAW